MNLEIHKLKTELDQDYINEKVAASSELAMNVPSDAQIKIIPATIPGSACITFLVKSPLVIRAVILFSDKLFEEGTCVSHPNKATSVVSVPVNSDKNIECDIDCKIIVGKSLSSEEFMTMHATVTYKKFGFFKNIPFSKDFSEGNAPKSQISYKIRERPSRVLLWAQKVFNLDTETDNWVISKSESLDFMVLNVKTDDQLILQARSESDGTLLQICYDDIETIGDMIQDFWTFAKISDLSPETIDFPIEKEAVTELIENISGYDQLRGHFSANIAESINSAKIFVVKAEFSLMLSDMASMKKNYAVVQQENGNLIAEYMKRRNNHEELVKSLKELNNFIRKASNLHIGLVKKEIVSSCREAIKNKKTADVVKIWLT